jgi:hypothetical protein
MTRLILAVSGLAALWMATGRMGAVAVMNVLTCHLPEPPDESDHRGAAQSGASPARFCAMPDCIRSSDLFDAPQEWADRACRGLRG